MHHIYVENENSIYSFSENSVIKSSNLNLNIEDIRNNPHIRYVTKDPIFYAGVALTNQCNLECKHCLVDTTKTRKQSIFYSKEEITDLIGKLFKQGLTRLSVTGGEPFLYPNLSYFYEYLGQLNIESKVNTNGTAIDINTLQHMIKNGLAEIDISLNNIENDSDSYFDNINYTDKRINAIKKVVENFKGMLTITASSVLTKKISNNLKGIADLLSHIGVDHWRLRELMPSIDKNKSVPEQVYSDDRILLRNIEDIVKQEYAIKIYGYLYDNIKFNLYNNNKHKRITMRCENMLNNYLFIEADKSMFWMSGMQNAELGYFGEIELNDVGLKLSEFKKISMTYPKRCVFCPAKQFCLKSNFITEPYSQLKERILFNNKISMTNPIFS